eukprot:gb/GFBE01034708.1/.p1 GENE.gb/GFBE01034708.1/~~gb/GFBE01034708.1/.p1  ORF type:complete len:146 (+),score=31.85 gb/GFBE01034708.1/:1-438(+)
MAYRETGYDEVHESLMSPSTLMTGQDQTYTRFDHLEQEWSDFQWQALNGAPFVSITSEDLLGAWADSLGNAVLVTCADDFLPPKLEAVLAQPPRKDITLNLRQTEDGGWSCGNASLDMAWSSTSKLHWTTADGRVSVWVRLGNLE